MPIPGPHLEFGKRTRATGKGEPGMYYELNWLGALLLGAGVFALLSRAAWVIVRAVRNHIVLRDRNGSRRRRLGPVGDRF
jgi:hypothetical protein